MALLNALDEPALIVDRFGTVLALNLAARRLVGPAAHVAALVTPNDWDQLDRLLRDGRAVSTLPGRRFVAPDGEQISLHARRLQDGSSDPLLLLRVDRTDRVRQRFLEMARRSAILTDQLGMAQRSNARLAQSARELAEAADTDPLTHLLNRRGFEPMVTRELSTRRPATLLLLDLDGFKDINDTHGHAVGDAVLVGVAHRLSDALGSAGQAARLGGDEFAALLDGDGDVLAGNPADWAARVFAQPMRTQVGPIQARASIGMAQAPRDGMTVERLLRAADLAMYRAKHARAGALFRPSPRSGEVTPTSHQG